MTYKVLDIAVYTINYSQYIKHPISNLKLQKLLYFIQGAFLAANGTPCFDEEIEAWSYGPVVPSVYKKFKRYGSNNIPRIEEYVISSSANNIEIKSCKAINISETDLSFINSIIDKFKYISATSLINITHQFDSPWHKSYKCGYNCIIKKELIRNYFRG